MSVDYPNTADFLRRCREPAESRQLESEVVIPDRTQVGKGTVYGKPCIACHFVGARTAESDRLVKLDRFGYTSANCPPDLVSAH